MSIIIRLQNLPWAANAADIRQYFQGLSIPEGGVHIVGGEKGDAFISFSTDEDARQAMLSDGGCIKEVQIRLLLSSRNEMQKVIETARQQTMQFTQVYIQPQLPIVGSLPPLTAKVLPQPQQQQVRPDQIVPMIRRQQPVMDPSAALLMSHNAQQQHSMLHQQQQLLLQQHHQQQQIQQQLQPQQQQQHLSPKALEIKDRDDKGHKRERTRSKSRDRRSKSTRSVGGGSNSSSRRDRSRSRDRRRRDRSRGRDRSRSKERHRTGGSRNSSGHGSVGKSYRSRSPAAKPATGEQQNQIKPWSCQYGNMQQPGPTDANQQQLPSTAVGSGAPMFTQFRTPPQPPIIAINPQNSYQQQPAPSKNEWPMVAGDEHQQQPYVPNNDFREAGVYGDGSGGSDDDDEDDRHAEYENSTSYQGRFNENNNAMRMRGPPGQDFNDQRGFVPNRGPRFNKPVRGGGHRPYEEFGRGGRGGGPRFNYQPPPRYNGNNNNNNNNGVDGGGRPSRFNLPQDGSSARPTRFSAAPQHLSSDSVPPAIDDSSKRLPQRFNDRYRYDVRNAPQVPRSDGLCVEVNNMSNHISYGDVRKLFEGIHIDGSSIKIQKHRQGVAFVRFDSNHNKNLAMRVDGTEYKGNNIVVKHLDDEAYERDNTDDRPYPSVGTVASTPTIVDHVDLVDDDEEEEKEEEKKGGPKKQADDKDKQPRDNKDKKTNDAANDDDDDDDDSDCNLVVCEKNNTKDAAAAKDGDEDLTRQDESLPTRFLKLKQIPITVTEEDVLNEIDGGCGDIRRVTIFPDGEFKGAAIEFHTVEAAESALKRNDCVLLCSTPVPVLPCTYREYLQFKRISRRFSKANNSGSGSSRHYHHNNHHQQNHHHQPPLIPSLTSQMPIPPPPPQNLQSMPPAHLRSNCVYIYGLPTTVTNTDITQFFADTSVLPDKIHIMLSKFGRPTGESYCEFSTPQQAHVALTKDHCFMGPERVYVEPISRSDMIQAITKPMQQRNQNQDMQSWPGGGMRGGMGGGPRPPHNNNLHHHQQGGPQSPYNGGGPYGGRPVQQQYNNNNNNMNISGGRGGYTPRMRGPNTGPDGFGQPGCVVALDNVPYRADVQEIVDFFDGFELNSQNVIRRFNDFGKPTGEARVNLRSPQDAMQAVRTLQNKPIFNRPVHLTLL